MTHSRQSGAGRRPAGAHESVSIALVGSGGAGVMTAGNVLLEAAALAGYYALMTRSSGPQIRGGEAAAMIRISVRQVECMDESFHVLAGVDWENLHRFAAEIPLAATVQGEVGRLVLRNDERRTRRRVDVAACHAGSISAPRTNFTM